MARNAGPGVRPHIYQFGIPEKPYFHDIGTGVKMISVSLVIKAEGFPFNRSQYENAPRSPRPTLENLYTAALFESDRKKVPHLILMAEPEIVQRARTLFAAAGDNSDEEEALDDALYMLRALKNCIKVQSIDQIAA